MISEEQVIWTYRVMLGRDPESAAIIASSRQVASVDVLREACLKSPEYLSKHPPEELPRRWVMASVLGGERMMWVNLADRYVSRGCLLDEYEPVETGVVRRLLKTGATMLDIGGNIGWFTLLATTLVGPTGHIHTFEPRPDIADYLGRTIDGNALGDMVTLRRQAVGAAAGSAHIVWHTGSDNPGGSFLGAVQDEAMAGVSVRVIAIDDLGLSACDFIKMDIEGAEHAALSGMRGLIARHRPIILSEVHSGQLKRVSGVSAELYVRSLDALGFSCHLVAAERMLDPIGNHPDLLANGLCNVLFIPQERLPEVRAALRIA